MYVYVDKEAVPEGDDKEAVPEGEQEGRESPDDQHFSAVTK